MIATDGSEASMDAADYAIEMARKCSSELIALYVIVSDITIFGPGPPRHIDKTKQEAQRYLDKIKHKLDEQMNNNNGDDDNNSIKLNLGQK